ncbi:signal peptidase I [Candidatus Woesearchaeota archaeon]|nr:signal peptidase I [Candidatus Woesearchaeota archaeon]
MLKKVKEHWLYKLAFEDDSFFGTVVHLLVAFIIIKYLVYPVLGFVLGTQYPIVAVVSCSMDHEAGFEKWWQSPSIKGTQEDFYSSYNITKQDFLRFPFKRGFWKGDLMVLGSPKNAKTGDVIVFFSKYTSQPIIHRVIAKNDEFITKGDGNNAPDPLMDRASKEQVVGKALLRVPFAGWLKVGLIKGICLFTNSEVCKAQTC